MTETHLVHNADNRTTGTLVRVPVSTEVPAGYVSYGSMSPGKGSRINHLYFMEQAGYPALYRREDGMVVARENIKAREVDAIVWSERILTDVFVWAPTKA